MKIVKDWGDAAYQTFFIGLAAFVWIVIAKLLVARYEAFIPQAASDLVAFA